MEENSITNEINLDGATELPSKSSSYQLFLQQLNIDNNSTDLYEPSHNPLEKAPSNSTVEVYQRNPPPYSETHAQSQEVESCRKSVDVLLDSKTLMKHDANSMEGSADFNDKLIWCEECAESKPTDCVDHPPLVITDSPPLSLARQTLPPHFSIITVPSQGHSVVTNKRLKKHTRFGPLVGVPTPHGDQNMFKVFSSKHTFTYVDTSSEDNSNWMRFIQLAQNASEQNMVAYQHNGHIYFSTKSLVAAGSQLKVGYADSYASLMGVKTLSQSVVREAPKKVVFKEGFPCETCELDFIDFDALDSHVCPPELTKQDATNKGRRTRNKRKGKPQKLGSAPKTKITARDEKRNRLDNAVSSVSKYQRVETETLKCDECDQVFHNRRRLERHKYVHTGEHPFKCIMATCQKTFNSKFKLTRHKLSHGTKAFPCPHCDKSFARKDNLKAHLVVHDSSRQLFKCDKTQCSKVYSSKVSYKAHVALHKVEEGSLECYICRKLYDNSQTLSLHIKVHAGSYKTRGIMEKKFKCDVCDMRFFASKDRDRHLRTHTKEKNFACNICEMKFSRSDHLKRHKLKVHPNGQKKPLRGGRASFKSTKEELSELSATEFTRSIQQILGDSNIPLEGTSTHDMGGTNTTVQIAPMLNHRPIIPAEQRTTSNGFLNVLSGNSGNQTNKQTSNWQPQASDGSIRYVLSGEPINQSESGMARYYITGDTIRLPSDNHVTTYLLPSETSHAASVNVDSLPRQSSLLLDSTHALPSDSLSNDFTADGMKVLTGLTPIFLHPDGTATDTDLIPMVYQSNPQ